MSSFATAAIVRPLNNLERIEANISQTSLTRISLPNDRIRSVFGIADEYSLEADEDQGEIFIHPLHNKPIHLTITTENGFTQDLQLIPTEGATEALILTKEPIAAPVRGEFSPLIRTEVEELLEACQENRIPVGYKDVSIELHPSDQTYLLIREIKKNHLRGLTFEVKDTGPLSESDFAKTCGLPLQDIVAIVMPPLSMTTGGLAHVVARAHP
jgi:hypothetical protein